MPKQAATQTLSKQQIKLLKSHTHALKPVVRLGQHGLTDAVLKELEIALDHHELVKVKVAAEDREARDSLFTVLSSKTKSQMVQQIGGIVVLYRRNEKNPKIDIG